MFNMNIFFMVMFCCHVLINELTDTPVGLDATIQMIHLVHTLLAL